MMRCLLLLWISETGLESESVAIFVDIVGEDGEEEGRWVEEEEVDSLDDIFGDLSKAETE